MEIKQPSNRLAELMEKADLSRADVAVELGVTEDTVRRLESRMQTKYLAPLMALLKVSSDHLLGFDRESTPEPAKAA